MSHALLEAKALHDGTDLRACVTQIVVEALQPVSVHRTREDGAEPELAVHRAQVNGTDAVAVTETTVSDRPTTLQGRAESARKAAREASALLADAAASVRLDGETRSHPLAPKSADVDCKHRKTAPLNGGMAKCADCGRIRRPDGSWYSV